jgi:hypothetical protein
MRSILTLLLLLPGFGRCLAGDANRAWDSERSDYRDKVHGGLSQQRTIADRRQSLDGRT